MAITDPTDISNLVAWLDAADATGTDGNAITAWPRAGGSIGSDPTIGTGPIMRRNRLNGSRDVVEFVAASSHYLTWGAAADWTFLSDGTGCSFFFVLCRPCTIQTPTAQVRTLFATGTRGSTVIGMTVSQEDRPATTSTEQALAIGIRNGTSGQAPIVSNPNFTLIMNRWSACGYTHKTQSGDDFFSYVNDVLIADEADAYVPSSSAPAYALQIGRLGTAADYGDMLLAELVIYDKELSAAERGDLFDYFRAKYGPSLLYPADAPTGTITTVVSDATYNSFPTVSTAYGRIDAIYYNSTAHLGAKGVIKRRTLSSGTWGSEATIVSDATYDVRGDRTKEILTAAGTKLLSYWLYDYTGATAIEDGAKVIRDTGSGYGSPITVTNDFLTAAIPGAPIQLDDGTILQPVRGVRSGHTLADADVASSSDDGASWTVLSTIAEGDTIGFAPNEYELYYASGTTVVALIRDAVNNSWWRSVSTNSGETWSTITRLMDGKAWPRGITVEQGDYYARIAHVRRNSNNESQWVLSTDAWQTCSVSIDLDTGSTDFQLYGDFYFDETTGEVWALWGEETSASDARVFWRHVITLDAMLFTGSASLTTAIQTLSASATFSSGDGTYTGAAALSASSQTLSATATFDSGTFTAAAALAASSQSLAASATHEVPEYTAAAALQVSSQTVTASAIFNTAIFTGAAALTTASQIVAASATFVGEPGTYTATANLTTASQILVGAAEMVGVVWPDPTDVRLGVVYGPTGAEYEGELVAGSTSYFPGLLF